MSRAHMHSFSREMFIRYQGEVQGEAELQARILVAERAQFRRWGRYASAMYQWGRLCWSHHPFNKPTSTLHIVAIHTRSHS